MKLKFLISAAALTLAAACATPATGPEAADRFDTFEYAAGAVDFSSYEKVYLAPVTASDELKGLVGYRPIGPTDTKRPLDEGDLEEKLSDLGDDLTKALGDAAMLVDAGGPGVLTVEVVLTKLEANRPTMADFAVEPGLSMSSVYSGKAEIEITLSENGKVLATARDGDYPQLNETLQPAPIWSTADRYFERVAGKLADLLS